MLGSGSGLGLGSGLGFLWVCTVDSDQGPRWKIEGITVTAGKSEVKFVIPPSIIYGYQFSANFISPSSQVGNIEGIIVIAR